MLKKIIVEGGLGSVIGEAENGNQCISRVLTMNPDIVLIDLLMPEMDGMETIIHLRNEGFRGLFIMISQIVNKDMVGEAYEKGIEYFIHKPINRVEVLTILRKTNEQFLLKDSLLAIRESLAHIGLEQPIQPKKSVKDIVQSILNDMGILGEAGSDDIVHIIEYLMNHMESTNHFPPLKDLYDAISAQEDILLIDIKKESKAIEQRIRRTILAAVTNLATLGSIDYTNDEFEYYAPRYFDFQEIRKHMIHLEEGNEDPLKAKINIKKFLQVLFLETWDKYHSS